MVDGTGAEAARHLTALEVVAIDGPLDAGRLGWVADLYGEVDPRYRSREFLEHLFARGPAGPALHAFVVADGVPVAHTAVIPTPARRGSDSLRAGKLEALFVAESHRGRRRDGTAVVRLLLDAVYDLADARGFQLIHAFVVPRVGRAIGFTRLDGVGSAVARRTAEAVAIRGRWAPRSECSRPPNSAYARSRAWDCALSGRVRRLRSCAPSPLTTRRCSRRLLSRVRRGRSSQTARSIGMRRRLTSGSWSPATVRARSCSCPAGRESRCAWRRGTLRRAA